MNRLLFLLSLVVGTLPLKSQNIVADKLITTGECSISGYIGEKLNLVLNNRIIAQDVNTLVNPFTVRGETSCWQSEFWGKWLTSAVLAEAYQPSPVLKKHLEDAVKGLIATQSADGYIGNYTPEHRLEAWDIWGRKYCMLGLISYFNSTGDKQCLNSACKIADGLIGELKSKQLKIVKLGNHHGMAASSVLEPICLLYGITKNKKYIDFAEEIVREWETPDGPQLLSKAGVDVASRFPPPSGDWYGWEQGQKAYEMMSCYEGLTELYRLTGKAEYLEAVEKVWQNINDTEINIAGSGASKECWFGGNRLQALPIHHYQETCVTVTWIKLSYQLLRLTGEAKYADAIEQSFYNALLGSLLPDGSDWAKYSPLSGERMKGTEQCGMGMNCCVASGPRALFLFPKAINMFYSEGVRINFFVPGTYSLIPPGGKEIKLTEVTDYPADGNVQITVSVPDEYIFKLQIRKPAWCRNISIQVNGYTFDPKDENGIISLTRVWKQGDVIVLNLDMPAEIHKLEGKPAYFAITRGPIVMARDSRLPGPNPDAIAEPVTKNGILSMTPVKSNDPSIWMQFSAEFLPESYAEEGPRPVSMVLCDYASAGNTYDERSWFRTWFPEIIDPSLR
ncbi:MAG TPA: beta-L-arabinofuranosidase domain-containing protein [Bacteroidales bacterium]|nr:beta-L-arabinofuranosidase domain-containing protein [Bacteroidales bacterium]